MRSCLTHPEATSVLRDEVMCQKAEAVSRTLEGDDAALRASVFGACLMGLTLARYLIALEPLASASREDVTRLMEPVLKVLVDGPAAAPCGCGRQAPAAGPPGPHVA